MNIKQLNRALGASLMVLGCMWLILVGNFNSAMLTMIFGQQVYYTNTE
jgi:hypothetical protein